MHPRQQPGPPPTPPHPAARALTSFAFATNIATVSNIATVVSNIAHHLRMYCSPLAHHLLIIILCQVYVLTLSNTDILKADEMNFELLSQAR